MTTQQLDRLLKAKIPCPETGIEIRRSFCDICAPGCHCGVDAYVKDGVIIKVEGTKEHPFSKGLLCTKGYATRQYIYRKDRIKTPLRRVGPKGSGQFEPITWDEAYAEIAEKFNGFKAEFGADSVAFFAGYNKWFRPFLHRLANEFGSGNYGTESSTCFRASEIAWDVSAGIMGHPDMGNAGVFLAWALNPYYSRYPMLAGIRRNKERGMKIIAIDPKITLFTTRDADLHLRPYPGTDGALALCFGNLLIQNGWIDRDYIEKNVLGFEEYAEYVKEFTPERTEQITGVPAEKILEAVRMMHEHMPMAINESSSSLTHHINAFQNYRAISTLSVITGNFDRVGGQLPDFATYVDCSPGYPTYEEEFMNEAALKTDRPRVGVTRVPLWGVMTHEMQAVDLSRQILEETPYPIKGLFACGINYRMFPDSGKMMEALKKLDFFVNLDLFMTDTCQVADLVLPVCSSLERADFKPYGGGYAYYTNPVIPPLYDSKTDAEIICEVSQALGIEDELFKAGPEACFQYMLRDLPVTVQEMRQSEFPIKIPTEPYVPGSYKFRTPSGKYEIKSSILESLKDHGLEGLPVYKGPLNDVDPGQYPFILSTGVRIPGALHSRLHNVSWLRSLRPNPLVDLNADDAKRMGIAKGDLVELYTPNGAIKVTANPTAAMLPGTLGIYHGYREADANLLLDSNHTDPYSGFPGFLSCRCGLRKAE